ncbi:MAG: hypothetical protein V4494_02070 [Chlamydiota bacterium]
MSAVKDITSVALSAQSASPAVPNGPSLDLQTFNKKVAKAAIEPMKLSVSGMVAGATNLAGATKGLQGAVATRDVASKGTLGQVTALAGIATSTLGIIEGAHKIQEGQLVGDSQTVIEGGTKLAASAAQTASAVGLVIFRPMNIASMAMGINATSFGSASLFGKLTFGLGQVSTGILGIFYALTGALGAFNLYHLLKFKYHKPNQLASNETKMNFLLGKLESKDTDFAKLNDFNTKDCIKEAKRMLPKVCAELKMSKEEWKELYAALGDKNLIQIGDAFKKRKLELKQEMQLARVIGDSAVEDLKKYKKLKEKKNFTDQERIELSNKSKVIIDKTEKAWDRKVIVNTLLTFAGIMGVGATAMALLCTGGIGAMVAVGILVVAVIIPMTLIDAYNYCTDLKESDPGIHDKKFLIITSVVAFLSMALSIGLMVALSAGLAPILLTLILGSFWLLINAYTYKKIGEAEKRANQKEKPVNELAEYIKAEWLDKLPKNVKPITNSAKSV